MNPYTLKGQTISDIQVSGNQALVVFDDGRRIYIPKTSTDGQGILLDFVNRVNALGALFSAPASGLFLLENGSGYIQLESGLGSLQLQG